MKLRDAHWPRGPLSVIPLETSWKVGHQPHPVDTNWHKCIFFIYQKGVISIFDGSNNLQTKFCLLKPHQSACGPHTYLMKFWIYNPKNQWSESNEILIFSKYCLTAKYEGSFYGIELSIRFQTQPSDATKTL